MAPIMELRPRSRRAAYLMALALVLAGAIPAGILGAFLGPIIASNSAGVADAQHTAATAARAARQAARVGRQSKTLSCQIGALLVGTPVVQPPAESHAAFVKDVRTAAAMLRKLKMIDCAAVKGAQGITSASIQRQIHQFRHVLPPAPKSSPRPKSNPAPNTSSSSPGAAPSTGSSPSSGSSPPSGGGPSPGSPPPPLGGPPPPPPGPPPPPPPSGGGPPPGGAVDQITHTLCRLNPLGVKVCVR